MIRRSPKIGSSDGPSIFDNICVESCCKKFSVSPSLQPDHLAICKRSPSLTAFKRTARALFLPRAAAIKPVQIGKGKYVFIQSLKSTTSYNRNFLKDLLKILQDSVHPLARASECTKNTLRRLGLPGLTIALVAHLIFPTSYSWHACILSYSPILNQAMREPHEIKRQKSPKGLLGSYQDTSKVSGFKTSEYGLASWA